jgi:phenylacetate-coenzyme A ligase PaaK-like adenylate-forming protein
MKPEITDRIFNIASQESFRECALDIFRIQSEENPVYKDFIRNLKIDPITIKDSAEIPFLPVSFFKSQKIISGSRVYEKIFESSGTTGADASKHYVVDKGLYERSFLESFRLFYGDPTEYLIAAMLPSYTERNNSSLVYMMDNLIRRSSDPSSGFYRDDIETLISAIDKARAQNRKILLMGVSFALLDLAEKYSPDLHGVIIMETGGMKGRRKEITRGELHSVLKNALNVNIIHSEYGMTELLSQAYSQGEGIFHCPPWMKILIRDLQDPLTVTTEHGTTGGLSIIDLANIHSCSFIATGDLGRLYEDGSFEVLGRIDNTDIRGCNLLI